MRTKLAGASIPWQPPSWAIVLTSKLRFMEAISKLCCDCGNKPTSKDNNAATTRTPSLAGTILRRWTAIAEHCIRIF